MSNEFLDNANKGKNNWWRYLITFISSLGLGQFLGPLLLILIIGLLTILGIYDGSSFKFTAVQSNISLMLIVIFFSFSISLIIFYLFVKFLHKKDLMSFVNASKGKDIAGKSISWIKRIRWNRFLKGMVLWFVFLTIFELILFISNPDAFTFNFNIGFISVIILLFIIVFPVQVTFEELLFRGYLLQSLSLKIKSPIIIILLSSLIFCIGHVLNTGSDVPLMIVNVSVTFLLGVLFCGFTLLDNGIELASGAHLVNNMIAFSISFSDVKLNNPSTLIQIVGFDPMIYALLLAISIIILGIILFFYKKEDVLKLLKNKL